MRTGLNRTSWIHWYLILFDFDWLYSSFFQHLERVFFYLQRLGNGLYRIWAGLPCGHHRLFNVRPSDTDLKFERNIPCKCKANFDVQPWPLLGGTRDAPIETRYFFFASKRRILRSSAFVLWLTFGVGTCLNGPKVADIQKRNKCGKNQPNTEKFQLIGIGDPNLFLISIVVFDIDC